MNTVGASAEDSGWTRAGNQQNQTQHLPVPLTLPWQGESAHQARAAQILGASFCVGSQPIYTPTIILTSLHDMFQGIIQYQQGSLLVQENKNRASM